MKILNALEELPDWDATTEEGLSILLRLLSPIAPHIAHHLWRELGFGEDIMQAPWPEPDPAALEQDEVELVVQVNGKLRGSIVVPKQADKATIENLALSNANVQRFVAGQNVKKVVVVPGRLVNLSFDEKQLDLRICPASCCCSSRAAASGCAAPRRCRSRRSTCPARPAASRST